VQAAWGGTGGYGASFVSRDPLQEQEDVRHVDWDDAERPVSVQLFGGEPAMMAEAATVVEPLERILSI